MRFILTDNWDDAANALAKRLIDELSSGKHVLWLTSGGSNVDAAVNIMHQIPEDLSANLSVMPVDERYGTPGHADSNWRKLSDSGFQSKKARLIPALKDGLDFKQNITHYNELAQQAFSEHEVVIGQLGIGADGHIAGILPGSPACDESKELITGYSAPPFKRMTLTFPGLKKIDAAYVLAFGDNKLEPLNRLKSETVPINEQPAQILKSIGETYVYNDQVGDAS